MRTLVALLALAVGVSPLLGSPEDDDQLRKQVAAKVSPKVYSNWKKLVEKEKASGEITAARKMEILKEVLDNIDNLPGAAAPPPVVKKAVAGVAPVPPGPKTPYLVGKPAGATTKPVLGASYNGYWMLMAHNDGEEPKWIFMEDGVKRTFTKSYIDLTDDPYDGPDFKHIKLGKSAAAPADDGVSPVVSAPAASVVGDAPVTNPYNGFNPFAGLQNPGSSSPSSPTSSFGNNPVVGNLGNLTGLNGLNGLNGNSTTPSISIDLTNKNDNTNTNTNTNKNGNGNNNGNKNGNKNGNGNSGSKSGSKSGNSGKCKTTYKHNQVTPCRRNSLQPKNHIHDHPVVVKPKHH